MQQMMNLDAEIGSYSKCPILMKMSDYFKWEPRFRAYCGFVHPDCTRSLDNVYTLPKFGDPTASYTEKHFESYTVEENKVFKLRQGLTQP